MLVVRMNPLRVYEPHECGPDGYPFLWHKGVVVKGPHKTGPEVGVKHLVRAEAGDRCVRCSHPYVVGESGRHELADGPATPDDPPMLGDWSEIHVLEEFDVRVTQTSHRKSVHWSSCDKRCTHGGPVRWREDWEHSWEEGTDRLLEAAVESGRGVEAIFTAWPDAEVEAAWRILTVHHLNGRKHDCRWWNLAALCQRCHLHIQKKVQMERVYPFEHTDWFKLYAAAWYAYAYLGEELTREQTAERLDELLALERMA